MSKLKNLVAFVTGGASGIGKAVVEKLVGGGARVCIADVSDEGCYFAKSLGENTRFFNTDVTNECQVMDSLNQTKMCYGKIDAVVNCAEIIKYGPIYDFKTDMSHCEDTFKSVIDVNLWGTFNVTRLAAGIMLKNKLDDNKQRGVIINIGSIMAFDSPADFVAYGTSKAAIVGMTTPLARGLAPKGIRVVTVSPGMTETPLIISQPKELRKLFLSLMLSPKRYVDPGEIAHLVQSIILNPVINAETIRADCGWRYSQVNNAEDIYPNPPC